MNRSYPINWKFLCLYCVFFTLIKSNLIIFAQGGWYSVSCDYQYGHQAIFFVNPDTGWIAKEIANVCYTTDGGKN